MSDWQWKNQIKKRDGYVCRRCGFDKNLHVHHILPKDKYPYEQDYPPNGLTLCGNCHSLLKDKEEQTDLRGFFPDDQEIDEQLKYLSENVSMNESQRVLLEGKEAQRINRSVKCEFRLGKKRSKQKQYELAIFAYDNVIHLKSDFVEAYYYRGKAKYELKRYKAAIYDYDNALRLRPDNVSVYFNRGLAKYALGQYKSVITDYNMVIRFTPDNVSAYFNRVWRTYKLGRHDTAIIDFDEAISLKPDFAKAYYYRGKAKYKQESHDAAITDFDEVIRLNTDFAEAYHYRGLGKCKLGQHDAAITDYDTANRLNPEICYYVLLQKIFGLDSSVIRELAGNPS